MALDMNRVELATKSESYEICFVPENDYRSFLKHQVPDLEQRVEGGNFIDMQGNILGKHHGYPFYTIGQRKGLEIALGEPMYVTQIKPETNEVILGKQEDLRKKQATVKGYNLIKYPDLKQPIEATTKIRYKDSGTLSTIHENEDKSITVDFYHDVQAIAPGQSAVFYEGEDLIGGGILQ
jgi:tRNA-uridine 2-sulfurtransferase